MKWTIKLERRAERQLKQMDKVQAQRVLRFLFERVATLENPRDIGEALQGEQFTSLWKYRVGDYRIVSYIKDAEIEILVVKIGHRREVYR
jgi:mRNA interferase RelE/StbE